MRKILENIIRDFLPKIIPRKAKKENSQQKIANEESTFQ